jgi:hypothetical protein
VGFEVTVDKIRESFEILLIREILIVRFQPDLQDIGDSQANWHHLLLIKLGLLLRCELHFWGHGESLDNNFQKLPWRRERFVGQQEGIQKLGV